MNGCSVFGLVFACAVTCVAGCVHLVLRGSSSCVAGVVLLPWVVKRRMRHHVFLYVEGEVEFARGQRRTRQLFFSHSWPTTWSWDLCVLARAFY